MLASLAVRRVHGYRNTMMKEAILTPLDHLRSVLTSQRLAVLATQTQAHPYASLVAFAATEDLRRIVFATPRETTKFRNLSDTPSVSLLIDTRTHSVQDFSSACAVTVLGEAAERDKDGPARLCDLFLARHPHLEAFVRAPSTALCCVEVQTCYLVTHFQDVVRMDVSAWPSSSL